MRPVGGIATATDSVPAAPLSPAPEEKPRNVLGIVALAISAVGFIFACIPGALIIGWILLPIGFILGIVALFMKDKPKWQGLTAIIVSVVGTIVGVAVFIALAAGAVNDAIDDTKTDVGNSVEEEPAEEEPAEEPAAPEAGSLENPHPKGYVASIFQGDEDNTLAEVSVAIKSADADAVIAQANQFNDPAQEGYHYVAVDYTITGANKTEPASASMLLYDWTLAQEDGTLIAENSSMVVLPDGWNQTYDLNDLYEGQTGVATVIYQVPDSYTGTLYATAYGSYITL
ncbi:DUF308 domain-containing protein [Microbacterium sp. CFH 31415]|uniref:DUF308 domain-containing protein n=1 Tax=Microbacterium sp. CFH 31415 TaxID=2921732 RepID=UPI0035ABA247